VSQETLSEKLKKEAKKLGFSAVGIARVPGSTRIKLRTSALQRWLKAGHQADMLWMEAPRRKNIETLLEGVKSVIAVGLNYYVKTKEKPKELSIARYGWGKDYHKLIEKKLKKLGQWLEKEQPSCQWKVCVDSSPLLDKAWAEEAGLGWIGKNSNLINQEIGSWMFLGHLLCTEALTPDKPSIPTCGECEKCIEACPTKAITEPFVINSNLCLAYHTIENKAQDLPAEIKNSMGNWIVGCDICQEVCPWNQKEIPSNNDPSIQPKEWILNLTTKDVLSWDDELWKEKLQGSTLKRIKPWMWRRNANAINQKN
tara:strand:+ start:1610 stop:2545 length:936 start_codon:yes stop_codon:yes gene_type:complete